MSEITIKLYVTQIEDGVAVGNSVLTTITIETGSDQIINTGEWQDYTGDPNGHLGGTTIGSTTPGLWQGDGTGNFTDGYLYTPGPISAGQSVKAILDAMKHNKYGFDASALVICFLEGTLIATPQGEVPVESLRAGDLVMTLDSGPQPLVWAGQSKITPERLDRCPNLYPVQFEAGSLGGGLPRRAVRVSPQHRVMLSDAGGHECLASARHIQAAGMPGTSIVRNKQSFTLVHIACANHQILLAEGAPMESLFTGPQAMRAMSSASRAELCAVFPSLRYGSNPMVAARPVLSRKAAVDLVAGIRC